MHGDFGRNGSMATNPPHSIHPSSCVILYQSCNPKTCQNILQKIKSTTKRDYIYPPSLAWSVFFFFFWFSFSFLEDKTLSYLRLMSVTVSGRCRCMAFLSRSSVYIAINERTKESISVKIKDKKGRKVDEREWQRCAYFGWFHFGRSSSSDETRKNYWLSQFNRMAANTRFTAPYKTSGRERGGGGWHIPILPKSLLSSLCRLVHFPTRCHSFLFASLLISLLLLL